MQRTAAAPEQFSRTVFLSETRMLYVGPILATRRHAHHAAQVVLAPDGLDIEDAANGRVRARAAVIPPRVAHGHGAAEHAAFLFLDGDDRVSRELSRHAAPRCETWVRDTLDVNVPRQPTPGDARALIASVLDALGRHEQPPAPRHPAVRRMCAYLNGGDRVDLARLSRDAGLSPRQMRAIFARDVGLSMRAYLRWRRVRRAVAAVQEGASLSAAAVAAGFADGAHLCRVIREQFGIAPAHVLRAVRWRRLDS